MDVEVDLLVSRLLMNLVRLVDVMIFVLHVCVLSSSHHLPLGVGFRSMYCFLLARLFPPRLAHPPCRDGH